MVGFASCLLILAEFEEGLLVVIAVVVDLFARYQLSGFVMGVGRLLLFFSMIMNAQQHIQPWVRGHTPAMPRRGVISSLSLSRERAMPGRVSCRES